ncbi:hypothetical protein GCM10009676_00970 [Prauserella halophila]|uniref:Uncharacterized protein n=1 Tax=Prauserella halophila TaxID=185641 RepID=A0ABN1VU35_9PSEU|nr:hypothetical protein [Prauserella halophila]MCP2234559.1 hypothetical protein [Prauserella halophila]
MRSRQVAGLALTVVGALLAVGCTTTVAGQAEVDSGSAGQDMMPDGMILLQEDGDGPHTFGCTVAFDACQVLSLEGAVDAGFEAELGSGPSPQLINWHQLADGAHHPEQGGMDTGLTNCSIPGASADRLSLTVYQAPFDNPEWRDTTERVFSRDFASTHADTEFESEKQLAGMRVVTMKKEIDTWSVAFFANEFYARMMVQAGESDSPEAVRDSLVETVVEGLAEGPRPPVAYAYADPYSWVPSPCALFTADDYAESWGHPDIGRVEERLSMSEVVLTHEKGNALHVRTSCQRQNEQAANMDAPSSTASPNGLTVELSHYRDESGAELSNNYDCDGDKKYSHPFGEPEKVDMELGDGHVCLIQYGRHAPGFTFKVGRTVVEITSWNLDIYDSGKRMNQVLLPPAQNVAERLAEL